MLDKTEANAIATLFAQTKKDQLMVGSIKSNIGHTESVAAYMAVLKALFALESNILAPNRNLFELNQEIRAFREKQLQVKNIVNKDIFL